jgi:pimeloyl-ACP methyl ester carboxylesterase
VTAPRFRLVPVMDHEVHVTEWGRPGAPALVMAHGLARTGRDFDELAAALSDQYHVLCPDMIGRGGSSWATEPEAEYSVEYFAGIASDLLDFFGIAQTAWLGTSLGGLIGMRLASGRDADRIGSLIVNDIGPEVPQAAIDRILTYVGDLPSFARFVEGETWLRVAYAPFGPAPDGYWRRMALTSLRRQGDGRLTLHYDPRITVQLSASANELESWDRWDRIETPCHVIRGASSDLLLPTTAERMAVSGPRPGITEIDGCGHAPTLSRESDALLVRDLLAGLRG